MDTTRAAPAGAEFGLSRQVAVSALWLAFYAQWSAIPTIILPDQVKAMVGKDAADAAAGAIVAAGSVVALVVTPVAGALSDRARSRFGRRRPFLAVGVTVSCAALAGLWLAAGSGRIALYLLAYLNLQVWWNWAAGPYAGFIPDVAPRERQGMASGWTNALGVAGVIVGDVLCIGLYQRGDWRAPGALVALSLACLALTLTVREPAMTGPRVRFSLGSFLRSFLISPRDHPAFYWVLATRFAVNMGAWSVQTFLFYYVATVLALPDDAARSLTATLLAVGACLAIPASLVGIKLADRVGLVRVVRMASWTMAAATAAYVLIALKPSVALAAPAVVVFAVANGAYGAADWLLALRVLPSGRDAGKDFGVWHVCMVAPQIVGPLAMGLLITAIRGVAPAPMAYEAAFAVAAAWFVVGSAFVGRVKIPPS